MKQAREHGLGVGFMDVIMREREDVVDWLEHRLFVRIMRNVVDVGFSNGVPEFVQTIERCSTTPPGTPPRSAG